jgi:hypothetical protein
MDEVLLQRSVLCIPSSSCSLWQPLVLRWVGAANLIHSMGWDPMQVRQLLRRSGEGRQILLLRSRRPGPCVSPGLSHQFRFGAAWRWRALGRFFVATLTCSHHQNLQEVSFCFNRNNANYAMPLLAPYAGSHEDYNNLSIKITIIAMCIDVACLCKWILNSSGLLNENTCMLDSLLQPLTEWTFPFIRQKHWFTTATCTTY